MRKFDRKKILMPISILLLCVCLCGGLASCGTGLIPTIEFFDGLEEDTDLLGGSEVASSGLEQISEYEREEITIHKQESQGNDDKQQTSAGQAYNSVTEVYMAVADSVVEITTEIVQTSIWMGQYISEGAGSGVIIDGRGFIVTNHHVIEGADNVIVRLTDGSEYSATLVGTDVSADLAVIKIDPADKELCVAPIGCSADLVVGEDVVAIGNPLGSLGGTLTTGIISATERNITVNGEEMVLLQTNAAINPGNSGGGLFNMAGQLVGVVNAKASGEDIEGLGFAIPVDFAHRVIEDLINFGYVRGVVDHGLILLDVTSQNLPAAYRKYGITTTGVIVIDVGDTSLKFGDRIISINGEAVNSSGYVDLICKRFSVGDTVTVSVARGSEVVEVELTLVERVPDSVTFD